MAKVKLLRYGVLQIAVILGLLGLSLAPTAAHVLKEDNGIDSVLHIPPEDNPQAGQPTELDFSFYDQKDIFNIADCNCGVSVVQNGKVIQKTGLTPAAQGAQLETYTHVTFPTVGIYNVVVNGSAKDGKFPTFRLTYLERVASSANGSASSTLPPSSTEPLVISAASIILLGMVAASAVNNGGRYAKKSQESVSVKAVNKRSVTHKKAKVSNGTR